MLSLTIDPWHGIFNEEPASLNIQTAGSKVAVGKLNQGFGSLNHIEV
jgi:hypothetical protein